MDHEIATTVYDVEAVRQDFPILHQEHSPGKPLVFLDNAASSQRPSAVIDAMSRYYATTHANVHRGIHKLSEEATAAYEQARAKVVAFINAVSVKEVIFTRGTTESINLVANSWGRSQLTAGDVVLTTQMEHHANIVPWQIMAQQVGFQVRYVPLLDNGTLDMEAYRTILKEEPVRLVAIVHASNVAGTVNPIAEMIPLAHDAGAVVLVDGAQSVPHISLDVQALDIDFLAFSGHKMIGPTGIGVLYGKEALLEAMPPWMGGGEMIDRVTLEGSTWNELPYKFEAGTPSIAEAIGLGAAVDYLTALGMDRIHAHQNAITAYAMAQLSEISGMRIIGPEAGQRGGLVAFNVDGLHAHDLAQMLDAEGVAVRSGHHCAQPLHDRFGVSGTARASFYLYNRFDEVDVLVSAIRHIQKLFGL